MPISRFLPSILGLAAGVIVAALLWKSHGPKNASIWGAGSALLGISIFGFLLGILSGYREARRARMRKDA